MWRKSLFSSNVRDCDIEVARRTANLNQLGGTSMAQLTGQTVKQMAWEMFDYEISDHDAQTVANTAGAMLTLSRHLGALPLSGIGPAFGYANLNAEAAHLSAKKA
jgi:hypothetical protein